MEHCKAVDSTSATVNRKAGNAERCEAHGRYHVVCRDKNGKLKWEDDIENVVCTAGKNLALDTILAGSSYTVTGPFMGLISSVGWSAVSAADTMASHTGWVEAGSGSNYPLLTARASCNGRFAAASAGAKALSAAVSFTIGATGGTVKGVFLVFGTGAVNTIGNTSGTLLSAGAFSGGDKAVDAADTLSVSYSLSL